MYVPIVSTLDNTHSIPARSCERMILCIGCSYTYGSTKTGDPRIVSSEDKKKYKQRGYSYFLNMALPKNYEVWNGGMCSTGTWAHLLMSRFLAQLQPDIIVFQIMCPCRNPKTQEEKDKVAALFDSNEHIYPIWHKSVKVADGIMSRIDKENWNEKQTEDFEIIRKITSVYNSRFIFLIDKEGYPYYNHNPDAIDRIKNELLRKEDTLVLTNYTNQIYWMCGKKEHPPWGDRHPNNLRSAFTAANILRVL